MMKCNDEITISNLKIKKNSKKYIIEVNDNEYELDEDTIIKYNILKGKVFTKDEFNEILYEIKLSNLFNKTLNYLSYGIRSKSEIMNYLKDNNKEKIINENDYYEIINRLCLIGYINDENYTKQIIDYYKKLKGKNFIIKFLEDKFIDNKLISNLIENYSEEEEYDCAMKNANKYSNQIRKYPFRKQKQLIYTKLMRDGFTNQSIKNVIDKIDLIDESNDSLIRDYKRLVTKYQNKDISSYEKNQYIKSGLINKGYDYNKIIDLFNNLDD